MKEQKHTSKQVNDNGDVFLRLLLHIRKVEERANFLRTMFTWGGGLKIDSKGP
jgi:hypothetical protein